VPGEARGKASSQAPLSIGLFTYTTLPRGSVVHAAHLADALSDAGHDVTLYAPHLDGRGFHRPLRARLCLVPAAPAPASPSEVLRQRTAELAGFLARGGIRHDIHHAGDSLTGNGLLDLRGQGHALHVVRTVHHVERFDDAFMAQCQDRSIRKADLCLAVSAATERDVALGFGVQCRRIGNGVVVDRFGKVDLDRVAIWRQRLPAGAGPLLLAVGGIEERKNTVRILRAFVRLRRRCSQAQLWLVGGASVLDHRAYRAEFDRELLQLPPATRAAVVELGVVDDEDLPALFRLANVLAVPSLQEGFGLVALEALAAGLAVVASDRAPFTEFLDRATATLVDPLSDVAIADGFAAALEMTPGARRIARDRARAHSWAKVAAAHVEHYRRLRGGASGALAAVEVLAKGKGRAGPTASTLRRAGVGPARA
jgi:glycosyltransferase-like protein